jgi:amidohydrolase
VTQDQSRSIRPSVRALQGEMVRLRRDLHAYPEIGFKETRSAEKLASALRENYAQVETGIAKTGLSVLLEPKHGSKRAILFRADMDALPVQEESGAEYASRNPGVMHACGHDGHMSVLLHTALHAARDPEKIGGAVRFVFQPAEEGPGGAEVMIREGILKEPPIEAAFGLHVWSGLSVGKVAVKAGPIMAAADEFEIVVRGRGGHAAYPHEAVDAVMVGCQIVVALQTVVSRNTDPFETAVVTIGTFNAGQAFNIIAETASLRGTLRTFNAKLRDDLIRRIQEVADGIARSFGASASVEFLTGYPATINDPRMADFVAGIASEVVGPENVVRDLVSMGGEDMSYFLNEVPGVYIFLGAENSERGIVHPHHNPRFDFDEEAMPTGVEIFLQIMERYWEAFPTPPGPPIR